MAHGEISEKPYILIAPADHYEVGAREFGTNGLKAIESIGPFSWVIASGPLITVHDSYVEARLGIGHHPHRHNERLFYIMAGELDHDDALNHIKGHMGPGDTGLFTEGRRGMLHSEWNHGGTVCHAYILVYPTNPIPEKAAFAVLSDSETPRYEERPGTLTKEIVGNRSSLKVHGDIRLFTDSIIEDGRQLEASFDPGEGGLISIQEGRARLESDELETKTTVLIPPRDDRRTISISAVGLARALRVTHGPGDGLILK